MNDDSKKDATIQVPCCELPIVLHRMLTTWTDWISGGRPERFHFELDGISLCSSCGTILQGMTSLTSECLREMGYEAKFIRSNLNKPSEKN